MTSDTAEFRRIHEEFRPKVYRHLARMVGESEAEDLTQSVMLRVSGGLARFRGDASLSTWIYRIATNAVIDRLRGPDAPAPVSGEAVAALEPPSPSSETRAVRREMNECIREFIERLPEKYRAALALAELQGHRNAEIAEALGISVAAVKIRLHRGRRLLRSALDAGCSFYRSEDNDLACDRRSPVGIGSVT